MLKKVEISNFLTIDKILFETDSKITAIVGESGTGKSLILKAIETAFSQKSSTNIVGHFSQEGSIKMFFKLNGKQQKTLSKFGIYDEEIVIEKIIRQKKTKAFINHEPVSTKVLSEIKDTLINIVSQNYRFRFFENENILGTLDMLVDKKIKEDFNKAYFEFLNTEEKKRETERKIGSINDKHPEILLESIEKTDPKQDEYENLLDRLKKIKSLSFAKDKSFEIIDRLYENDRSVESTLIDINGIFEKMSGMGLDTKELTDTIKNVIELLSGIKGRIYDIQNNTPEGSVDEIESRLFELEQLQRKFNKPLNRIVEEKENLKTLITQRENLQFELKQIEESLKEKRANLAKLADVLSKDRKATSKAIQERIHQFLSEMLLENSVVKFNFKDKTIDRSGKDSVDILFSANPDIKVDRIEKAASGGERSRFILAMEAANSMIREISETLILDEIEAGISDRTLEKTAGVIKKLSKNNQIILITHNEKLSKIADKLFRIEKEFDGSTTKSFIECIR